MEENKILTYEEAYELCRNYIEGIKKSEQIKLWCQKNNIPYTAINQILRLDGTEKSYPQTIAKILQLIHPGTDIEYMTKLFFEVE